VGKRKKEKHGKCFVHFETTILGNVLRNEGLRTARDDYILAPPHSSTPSVISHIFPRVCKVHGFWCIKFGAFDTLIMGKSGKEGFSE
jgi:hypothetical protein